MCKAYSLDLRRRIVSSGEFGLLTREAVKRFSIGKASVGAWVRLQRFAGDVVPKRQGHGPGSIPNPHTDFILASIDTQKDVTVSEMSEALAGEKHFRVHTSTLWYGVDRRGMTLKKRQLTRLNKTEKTLG